MPAETVIGRERRRPDAPDKLRGATVYGADLRLDGLLHVRLVVSPHAHARVRSIDVSAAVRSPGVAAVVPGREIPDPLMASEEVRYVGHPVAAVVAASEAAACDAADLVSVAYEVLPAVLDVESGIDPAGEAGDADAGAHGADAGGDAHSVRYRRGRPEAGFAAADAVVEETFRVPAVHQAYIEPQVCIARPEPGGGTTIWASTQAPWVVRAGVARTLGVPEGRVRVVPLPVGGGFGGKFGLIEGTAAVLAQRLGRPVRLLYDRTLDFLAGRPATESVLHVRLGGCRDGRLTALQAEVTFDAGCQSGAPYGIAALLLAGTYRVPHFDVVAGERLTHKRPGGAYRAPGAAQAYFALECQMDALARALGLDPLEFRLANAAREGDLRPDGRPWPRLGLVECLQRLRAHPLWQRRSAAPPGEGWGVAVGGWRGGLEPAAATCRLEGDGRLVVHVGSVDLTGSYGALEMIAAEAFGVPAERVAVRGGDTDQAPYGGSAGGSKIVYTVGPAVHAAALEARDQALGIAAGLLEAAPDDLVIADGRVHVRGAPGRGVGLADIVRESTRFGAEYAPVFGRGRSVNREPAPMFTAHLCHVRVDRGTGAVRVLDYVAAQDVGRAINPAEVAGQVHGGVAQGIGRALLERLVYDDQGQPLAVTLMDYLLPTASDVPRIAAEIVEVPSALGPFGARGAGEPPIVPVMAAVANAVRDATGATCPQAPFGPERVLAAAPAVGAVPGGTGRGADDTPKG